METRASRYFSEHSKPKEDNSQDQLILPKRRRKSDTNEPYIPSSLSATVPMARRIRLDEVFFNQEATQLAKALLGKILVRSVDNPNGGEQICGRIVETEAYLGMEDKGSHTFQQRRTARTEAMFMKPGTVVNFKNLFKIVVQILQKHLLYSDLCLLHLRHVQLHEHLKRRSWSRCFTTSHRTRIRIGAHGILPQKQIKNSATDSIFQTSSVV